MTTAENRGGSTNAGVLCPSCGSRKCELQATGRKAGVVIGGVLGAILAAGMSGAKVGAISGAVVASVISRQPPVTTMGAISGALVGFCWGAIAGHALGAEIDEKVLGLYCCLDCGADFSK